MLLSIVVVPAIVCVLQYVWIDSLMNKKNVLKKYQREPDSPGVYRDKRTGEKVCGVCLRGKGMISPLLKSGEGGALWCVPCKTQIN